MIGEGSGMPRDDRVSRRLALGPAALALAAAAAFADDPPPAGPIVHPPGFVAQYVPKSDAAEPSSSGDHGGLDAVLPADAGRVTLESYWDNGYHLESSDKRFRLHIGGN